VLDLRFLLEWSDFLGPGCVIVGRRLEIR